MIYVSLFLCGSVFGATLGVIVMGALLGQRRSDED